MFTYIFRVGFFVLFICGGFWCILCFFIIYLFFYYYYVVVVFYGVEGVLFFEVLFLFFVLFLTGDVTIY